MKKIYLFCAFFIVIGSISAQSFESFSVQAGLNFTTIRGDDSHIFFKDKTLESDIAVRSSWGINSCFNLTKKYSLQPELNYTLVGTDYKIVYYKHIIAKYNYIQFTLLLKLLGEQPKSKKSLFNIFLGPSLSYQVSAKWTLTSNNWSDDIQVEFVNDYDFGIVAGLETTGKNKFIGIRYYHGLAKIINEDNVNLDTYNRYISIYFGFRLFQRNI